MAIEQIIDKILEIHRASVEIDQQVPTCSLGGLYEPEWHISGFRAFKEVADLLNGGCFEIEDTGSSPYRYKCYFMCRGVYVFCMVHTLKEVQKDESVAAN